MAQRAYGIVISVRECPSGYIVAILQKVGKYLGFSKKKISVGSIVDASWHARLESQLGNWTIYDEYNVHMSILMSDNKKIMCLMFICSICESCLVERCEAEYLFSSIIHFLRCAGIPNSSSHEIQNNYNFLFAYLSVERSIIEHLSYGEILLSKNTNMISDQHIEQVQTDYFAVAISDDSSLNRIRSNLQCDVLQFADIEYMVMMLESYTQYLRQCEIKFSLMSFRERILKALKKEIH
jgi:hypothetical protein